MHKPNQIKLKPDLGPFMPSGQEMDWIIAAHRVPHKLRGNNQPHIFDQFAHFIKK